MNKIIGVLLGATIGVMMLGLVLAPVISDAIDDTGEKYNNAAGILSKVYDGETIVIDVDVETGAISVNGETASSAGLAVVADKFVVTSSAGSILYNSIDGTTERTTDLSISINANVATIDGTTYDLDWCFYANPDGDYRMYPNASANRDIYVNSIDQIYGSNWITSTGKWFSFHGDDVLINGDTAVKAQYTLDPVDGYSNLYTIKIGGGSEGEYTFMDGDYQVFPRFWVMPHEVVGYSDSENSYVSILGAIPVVLIAALVATIALMFSRRY